MKSGYGVIYQKELEAGEYQLLVINFGDDEIENEFTVSTYSDYGVEIAEEAESLKSAITRAEEKDSGDVIVSKVNGRTVTGKSYFDDTRQVLHISVEKKYKNNAKITAEFITEGKFPFASI